MWVRNWMCKLGSSSISTTCSKSFLHWLHIIDKCNKTELSQKNEGDWMVGLFHLNKHTHTHTQPPIYFYPDSVHISSFFPFLSISELMGKNGNVPVSQTIMVLISGAGVPFPQWWKHILWQMSQGDHQLVGLQTASQVISQQRVRNLVGQSLN